jgi:hypothetical protein
VLAQRGPTLPQLLLQQQEGPAAAQQRLQQRLRQQLRQRHCHHLS